MGRVGKKTFGILHGEGNGGGDHKRCCLAGDGSKRFASQSIDLCELSFPRVLQRYYGLSKTMIEKKSYYKLLESSLLEISEATYGTLLVT